MDACPPSHTYRRIRYRRIVSKVSTVQFEKKKDSEIYTIPEKKKEKEIS
jgi:hypothetical protein